MILRFSIFACACAALAACQPAVPDSGFSGTANPGTGVGVETSYEALRAREAALQSSRPVPVGPSVETTVLPPSSNQSVAVQRQTTPNRTVSVARQPSQEEYLGTAPRQPASVQTSQYNDADARAGTAANSGVAVVNASPSNAPPVLIDNPGISDEQDFDAVSERQSIESDAARLAANRQQYEVVAPEALPRRSGAQQPNIVAYALSTSHPRGTRVYRRVGLNAQSKFERNCAAYASNDQAQIDFLARGGPQRDRKGLDPDGDGFACSWDPTPFRRASSG